MDERELTPFGVAKYFEEQVPQVLESLNQDPEGMYEIVYRVGDLIVSAHLWREPSFLEIRAEEFSESDRGFLRQCHVSTDEASTDAVL
jgi:hypothetical protein